MKMFIVFYDKNEVLNVVRWHGAMNIATSFYFICHESLDKVQIMLNSIGIDTSYIDNMGPWENYDNPIEQ